jgi:hypothetical protein
MKQIVTLTLVLFLVLLSEIGFAQPRYRITDFLDPKLRSLSVHVQSGTSSYFGDLCPTGDCYSKGNFNFGIGMNRRLNDYLFFTFNAQYYRISASDAEFGNSGRLKRNLSFRSDNFEFSFIGNFEFLNYNTFRYMNRSEFPISMFAFLGFGITTNNPTAKLGNTYYDLRPLKTEGVDYSPIAAVVPFGLGIGYKILSNLDVSIMAGYRYAFTDYLDDVSKTYVDPLTLSSPEAVKLAYRGDEVGFPGYGAGAQRGNPSSKDGYLLFNFKVEYSLPVNPYLRLFGGEQRTVKGRTQLSAPSKSIKQK